MPAQKKIGSARHAWAGNAGFLLNEKPLLKEGLLCFLEGRVVGKVVVLTVLVVGVQVLA